jgi:glycosyltransferase involved in cell wall biosynthesis
MDLANQLGTQRSFVCYGVVESSRELRQNWENEPLRVLFSGTLLKDVGSEMLISAIKILQKNKPDFFDRLHFVVSGKGPYAKQFRSLSEQMPEWLTFFDVLPRESYLNILGESHVGVSLRLSKYEMSATTFPSKVVEYSDFGLLLVTTRVSDVPILFGDGAIYLEKEEASELAKVFVSLVGRSDELRAMAQTGRAHMVSKCSKEFVASRLSSLLENKL